MERHGLTLDEPNLSGDEYLSQPHICVRDKRGARLHLHEERTFTMMTDAEYISVQTLILSNLVLSLISVL